MTDKEWDLLVSLFDAGSPRKEDEEKLTNELLGVWRGQRGHQHDLSRVQGQTKE